MGDQADALVSCRAVLTPIECLIPPRDEFEVAGQFLETSADFRSDWGIFHDDRMQSAD